MKEYEPSNGYIRRICNKCLFHGNITHSQLSTNCEFSNDGSRMKWVSANNYEQYPHIAAAHDEPCLGFISKKAIRNICRDIILGEKKDCKGGQSMTGIVVTPKGEVETRELKEPLHQSAGAVVGGLIEIVRPRRLERPYIMIVNENFINLRLPLNPVGSYLYCTDEHGHPICGNIIILKEEDQEITGLNLHEQLQLTIAMLAIAGRNK